MNSKFYAKSDSEETIKEHTDKLLNNLEILKNLYGDKIVKASSIEKERFWELMRIICIYHDAGKVFSGFQNVIRSRLGLELIPSKISNSDIKHEQISPVFIPYKKYNLTPKERKLVYQAIFYHHERNIAHINSKFLEEIIEEDIKPKLDEIKNELQIEIETENLKLSYLGFVEGQSRITEGDELYNDYCLLKGLLHRLDHSSSAGIEIEDKTEEEISEYTKAFIKSKNSNLNDLQTYAENNQDKNLIIVGSTGIGKTEGALLWSKNCKTFFTLPLRVSINAIYDRIYKELGYKKHVGLLHSTALDYLEESEIDEKSNAEKMEMSYNLFQKITTCTIDQIFPFVFKYRGYEKIYSTMSYSKVVIDEIQAYSPEIVAAILKGLQMINNLGGKFMVMTATLPRIYKEKLEELGIQFEYKEFTKDTKRHKIELLDKKINDDIEEIYEKSKSKKVLVIVNTINKAIELYFQLKELGTEDINVLHSRFIQSDRSEKERNIKEFSNKKEEHGIWITTQIVEASLDIDFDLLYTEMSTLDSLFQRLGRCFRSREYSQQESNVKIYIKEVSGIPYIYDPEIHQKSIELLQEYNGKILEEKTKISLVDKLYSKEILNETKFYDKFKQAVRVLENRVDYETSKKEAQEILRGIDNIDVIPRSIYDANLRLFEQYEKEKNNEEKHKIRRELNKLFISINKSNMWKLGNYINQCPYLKDKYIIDTKYDKEIGLMLKMDEGYEIKTREL